MLKRPHVDEFLQKMGELFECVLFTASLAKVCLNFAIFIAVMCVFSNKAVRPLELWTNFLFHCSGL